MVTWIFRLTILSYAYAICFFVRTFKFKVAIIKNLVKNTVW